MIQLRTIDEHAGNLSNLILNGFNYLSGQEKWYQALAHLDMASGIANIEFDRLRYNGSYAIGMGCDAADDIAELQNRIEKKLIISLCRFNFIWSALETVIDIAVPPKLIKNPRGKINNACYFLKHNIPPALSFKAYEDALFLLESAIGKNSRHNETIKDGLPYGDHISDSGKGIFLAYKLRNKLVHGSLIIPEANEEEEDYTDNDIVELSSRLTLYTIQMLSIIFWKEKFPTIKWDIGTDIDEIDIFTAFTNIQYEEDFSQIPLQQNLFI